MQQKRDLRFQSRQKDNYGTVPLVFHIWCTACLFEQASSLANKHFHCLNSSGRKRTSELRYECDDAFQYIKVRQARRRRRIKNGSPSTHPLTGRELRALRQHQRESSRSPFVFVSERGAPLNPAGFSRMVERAGKAAGLGLKAHAHMLRHACGYALANAGHDTRALQAYLGHRNIQNTVRYSELAPGRFSGFWQD